jgi:nucleotide-binding universal stress UspA family protein
MTTPAIKTILVPMIFSKLSNRAIETAKKIAQLFDATVHLAHVHEFYYPLGLSRLCRFRLSLVGTTLRFSGIGSLKRWEKNGVGAVNCHFSGWRATLQ